MARILQRYSPSNVVLSLVDMHGRAFLDDIFHRRNVMSMDEALASVLGNQEGDCFSQQDQCVKLGTTVVAVNLSESMDTSLVISTRGFNRRYSHDGPPRFIEEHMPHRSVSHAFLGERRVSATFYLEHADSGAFEEAFLSIGNTIWEDF
jgi:hypothetical protein